ncbi:MAG: sigma-E factor negative regulatory protein, partial [Caldimonas sp.]
MTTDHDEEFAAARERLSALVDGELPGVAVEPACLQWRDSAESRATWHAYQLIGDVLRSDDLATQPGRDSCFLVALRERLAAEPVVLAPRPLETLTVPVRDRHSWSWKTPTAVAAGFAVVAGALMLTRVPEAGADRAAATLAQGVAPRAATTVAIATPQAAVRLEPSEPAAVVAGGEFIRDAHLDRY